jgi:septal ring factor EnvC (AmiA/AmiB activator)
MKNRAIWFIKIILFQVLAGTLWVFPVNAQKDVKASLQTQKEQIERDIEYTNQLLDETKKSKSSSLNELAIINAKISKREELIAKMNEEIRLIDEKLSASNHEIDRLTHELAILKDEYARMIYYAFCNRKSYDKLMFVFSSRDFNQAYQRLKYLQQYSVYRQTQGKLIQKTQREISQQILVLEAQKREKQKLLDDLEVEKQKLDLTKEEKNNTIQSLSRKEVELKKSIKEKEKAARRLKEAIEAIIAEEMRLAAEAAKGKAATVSPEMFALTPEEQQLSDNFALNQEKLPWPTERGIIASTFGEHPHPVLSGVKVRNNGIDILTNTGSYARAVFDGVVTRVVTVPNYFKVVIIRHGEYLTVYSNLEEVTVTKGQKVATKQIIGRIHTDADKAKTELHFEIWKGKTLLDPSDWIAQP